MITSEQIRSARAALDWSIEQLASATCISSRTIMRMEAMSGVPNSTKGNLNSIKTALEAAGIEFIGTPDDRPGIRFNPSHNQK